jgi:tyrosyl-tRNA synthetase
MSKGDGMSYAEFSYPLMQAWDWWQMFLGKGIRMQIGGSDQYGNITAGIAAIKYISSYHPNSIERGKAHAVGEPMGFTVPLLTTSSGEKFGKSAGNAIWLDKSMTSSFDLYGYFLRTSDEDVGKYLKMFTFMPLEDIDLVLEDHKKSPSLRRAQHQLAREFVELVHGAQEAKDTEVQHRLIFKSILSQPLTTPSDLGIEAGKLTPNEVPRANVKLPRTLIMSKSVGKVLYACGLAASASEGHRIASKHGAYIGGNPEKKTHVAMPDASISWSQIRNWDPKVTKSYLVHGDLLLLRRSKHNIKIIHLVSDEEYAMSGETYPGMDSLWRIDVLKRMVVKEEITKEERQAVENMLEEEEAKAALSGAGHDSHAVKVGDSEDIFPAKASANP